MTALFADRQKHVKKPILRLLLTGLEITYVSISTSGELLGTQVL
jgi:hypothetical protein